jgi:NAD(P)-dependent dehydrogenase (short-subunit alcohol dehydrogenase family)
MSTVLITGASRGIGKALADQYEADGWDVIRTCRDPIGAGIPDALKLDVTNPDDVCDAAEALSGRPIDVLINNAGVIGQRDAALGSIDYRLWEETFRINTLAPIRVAEALAANVAASDRKTMVFISSVMGSIARNGGGHYLYRSTKAALNAAMVSLSQELAARGVICISMHPGWVQTDMGGPTASVTVPDSAAGIRRVVGGLQSSDNGRFYDYAGDEIPW